MNFDVAIHSWIEVEQGTRETCYLVEYSIYKDGDVGSGRDIIWVDNKAHREGLEKHFKAVVLGRRKK